MKFQICQNMTLKTLKMYFSGQNFVFEKMVPRIGSCTYRWAWGWTCWKRFSVFWEFMKNEQNFDKKLKTIRLWTISVIFSWNFKNNLVENRCDQNRKNNLKWKNRTENFNPRKEWECVVYWPAWNYLRLENVRLKILNTALTIMSDFENPHNFRLRTAYHIIINYVLKCICFQRIKSQFVFIIIDDL